MPDPDEPRPPDPPPVVVAVTPGSSTYAGQDRRQHRDGTTSRADVNLSIQPPLDQSMLYGVSPKWQGWVRLGGVGILAVIAIVAVGDWRASDRRSEERDDRRYVEMLEFQRARESQEDRRHDANMAKLDALVATINAAMDRGGAAAGESRALRAEVAALAAKLEDVLDRLFAELKRLAPRKKADKSGPELLGEWMGKLHQFPVFGVFPVVAPKVMPELAPRPRPANGYTQSGGAR